MQYWKTLNSLKLSNPFHFTRSLHHQKYSSCLTFATKSKVGYSSGHCTSEPSTQQQSQVRKMSKSSKTEPRLSPWQQGFYRYFLPIQTRIMDTDWFGHINNVVYYSYFDTIINHYLFRNCGLRHPRQGTDEPSIVGFMVDTRCTYKQPINYPEAVLAGVAVTKLGNSSVTYTVGVFAERGAGAKAIDDAGRVPSIAGDLLESNEIAQFGSHQDIACAVGQCVHVFVDLNGDQRPTRIPESVRTPFQKLYVPFDFDISKL